MTQYDQIRVSDCVYYVEFFLRLLSCIKLCTFLCRLVLFVGTLAK